MDYMDLSTDSPYARNSSTFGRPQNQSWGELPPESEKKILQQNETLAAELDDSHNRL
jgi:hypothetical protein